MLYTISGGMGSTQLYVKGDEMSVLIQTNCIVIKCPGFISDYWDLEKQVTFTLASTRHQNHATW